MSMNRRFPRKFPVSSNFRFIGVITGISPRRQSSCYSIFIQKRHDSRSSLLRSKKKQLTSRSCSSLPVSPPSLKISTSPHVDSGPLIFYYLRDPPLFPTSSQQAVSMLLRRHRWNAVARSSKYIFGGRTSWGAGRYMCGITYADRQACTRHMK